MATPSKYDALLKILYSHAATWNLPFSGFFHITARDAALRILRGIDSKRKGQASCTPKPPKKRACYSKSRYSTEKKAKQVAGRVFDERGVKLRTYPCTTCGGYHLTKLEAAKQ